MKMRKGIDGLLQGIEVEAQAERSRDTAQLKALTQYYDLFGQFLVLRQKKGWTQRQLAEASGVPQAEVSRIERGKANPTVQTLLFLISALNGTIQLQPSGRG